MENDTPKIKVKQVRGHWEVYLAESFIAPLTATLRQSKKLLTFFTIDLKGEFNYG